MYPIAHPETRDTMAVVGSFFQGLLPPGQWNGARDENNEL